MYDTDLCRLRLDPDKEDALIKYVKDRRYMLMISLYISGFLSVVLAPFAIAEINNILSGTYYTVGYGRRRRSSVIVFWLFMLVTFVVNFFTGFGRVFGPGSDYDCLKKGKYGFGTMTLGGKKHDSGKHPYYVCDKLDNVYICPVFLDYKNANFGDEMFCVVLDNGKRFAFGPDKKPGWDMD